MRVFKGDDSLREAAALLRSGGVVAIPTETVYGLAADASNARAVARIYEIKGRAESKRLPVLVGGAEDAERLCGGLPPLAKRLAGRLWPGPFTLVVPKGRDTVALRCPSHPDALKILRYADVPLVLTSANRSGHPEALTAESVCAALSDMPDGVVDGGSCQGGVPSAIISLTGDSPKILRFGGGIFGVTGGSGAGKSLLLEHWRGRGVTAINADEVYHGLLKDCAPMRDELRERFPDAFTDRYTLNRPALGAIVFSDAQALSDLNGITHKYVIGGTLRQIDALRGEGVQAVALEALYLFESGMSDMCAVTFGVTAPPEERLRRIMERDGLTREDALLRIQSQKPDSYYREQCDIILENDGRKDWLP